MSKAFVFVVLVACFGDSLCLSRHHEHHKISIPTLELEDVVRELDNQLHDLETEAEARARVNWQTIATRVMEKEVAERRERGEMPPPQYDVGDSRIDALLFASAEPFWAGAIRQVLSLNPASLLQLNPETIANPLDYHEVMASCVATYNAYIIWEGSAETAKTLTGLIPVWNVIQDVATTGQEVEHQLQRNVELTVRDDSENSALRGVGRGAEVVGTTAIDKVLSWLTVGILPAIGTAGRGLTGVVSNLWHGRERRSYALGCTACFLAAMAKRAIKAEVPSSVQAEQYKVRFVKDDARRAVWSTIGDETNQICGFPIPSVADQETYDLELGFFYESVSELLEVSKYFEQLFSVIGQPGGGGSEVSRHWLAATDFQKAVHLVDTTAVRHVMSYFWEPLIVAHDDRYRDIVILRDLLGPRSEWR